MTAEPVLATPRLVLRTFAAGDEEAMAEVLCDPEVMRFGMGTLVPGEVGAWLEERAEHEAGHGFGPWAVRLRLSGVVIVDHVFTNLGLARVIALVDHGNAASVRVAEKLGMRHEADVMLPGYDHPDRPYSARPPT